MVDNDGHVTLHIPLKEHQLAALIIFMISLPGFFLNLIVALFTRKLKTLNNPFGRMMASQATGESVLCAVFAFYFSPMVFFQIDWMDQHSRHAGWINLIAYDICIWSHLFIALNRLCAICIPLKYEYYFSERNTRYIILTSWAIPIVTAIVLYKFYDCDFYYSSQFWAFVFTSNEECGFISWNIDFYKDISIVIVIAIVDTITIAEIFLQKQVGGSRQTDNSQQGRRRRREINFLKQAVLQGVVFVIELLTYFIFAWWFVEQKWMVYALTTVAWNLVHTTDAIIIISLNREFRKFLFSAGRMIRELEERIGMHQAQISTQQREAGRVYSYHVLSDSVADSSQANTISQRVNESSRG